MNAAEVAISKLFVKAYASPHLVYPGRLDRGRHSEVRDARAYDHLLDHRARYYRLHHRRGRNSHVRSADKPTLSSCRLHSVDSGCNSNPIRLHQTADSFPARWIASS